MIIFYDFSTYEYLSGWTKISQRGTTRKSHRHIQRQGTRHNFSVMFFGLIFY